MGCAWGWGRRQSWEAAPRRASPTKHTRFQTPGARLWPLAGAARAPQTGGLTPPGMDWPSVLGARSCVSSMRVCLSVQVFFLYEDTSDVGLGSTLVVSC